ncbi:MAG: carboxylesterase family protein [Gammaproteobacteria bacterium]|jgi:para-nitrobenzyl esterase|nr:carboxylesterase family protein [Gammaproteobacteria bacterium]MBU1353854.1 carboxylesterase family protein [Gammaproteobacteria bacterium]MBU1506258.1 carboxylesterase family protein [Gammaproteobacteria bacterium]MBU2120841.1 carboxylesterase family protein [Gammaproteobacteria bacterium]MBU2169345.1 carboxylesterase family protein [Gammaproteobacteria bacterium]
MIDSRWRLQWLGAAVSVLAMAGCGGGSGLVPELRETAYGKVRGVDDSHVTGTYAWKGIPFAQPPVGELRWQPPVTPAAWSGERDATRFGHACLQMGRLYGPGANNRFDNTIGETLGTPVGNEDCLTLNIWRPANTQDNLPVLLFLHGGSAISGYTADPVYDGAALARKANAVVVTANYRLDVLGFLQMPQLHTGTGPYTGNYALLDNVQALQFIKRNIGNFGGNAGNVTLMGQSAGAINALALLTAPQAAGLFHKILPISGGISLPSNLPAGTIPTLNPASKYAAQSGALLAALALADGLAPDGAAAAALVAGWTPAQTATYLRGKDARVVLQTVLQKGLTGSGPIPDGVVVPANPVGDIAAGRYHKVPVLSGYTADEAKLFAPFLALLGGKPGMKITDAERFAMTQNFNPDAPASLMVADILDPSYLPVTTPATGYNARMKLLGSLFIDPSRDNLLDTLRTQQSNVWSYQFDWAQQPAPWADVYGAAHGFDLPFVFGNFGPSLLAKAANSTANQPGRLALSGVMMDSVRAFVHTGNPNHVGLGQEWQPWPRKFIFDADLKATRLSIQ